MKKQILLLIFVCVILKAGNPESRLSPAYYDVVLDDFGVNNRDVTGDTDYTHQSLLGYDLGLRLFTEDFDQYKGGGFWSAYASGNGVVVSNPWSGVIIDSFETSSSLDSGYTLFGNDSLEVIFDCRGASGNDTWAGVSLSLPGDTAFIKSEFGAKISAKGEVCWDLSTVRSILIRGEIKGAVSLNFAGRMGEEYSRLTSYKVQSSDLSKRESFWLNIPMDEFRPASWSGAEWGDIQDSIHTFSIALDPEFSDYVELSIDKIEFSFDSDEGIFQAFPFLNPDLNPATIIPVQIQQNEIQVIATSGGIEIVNLRSDHVTLELCTVNGRKIGELSSVVNEGKAFLSLDKFNLATGIYTVSIKGISDNKVHKITVK